MVPRVVEMDSCISGFGIEYALHSKTLVPAMLRVCWESRLVGLKFYHELNLNKKFNDSTFINWDIDTILFKSRHGLKSFLNLMTDFDDEPRIDSVVTFGLDKEDRYNFFEDTRAAKQSPINQCCKRLAVHLDHLSFFTSHFKRDQHLKQFRELLIVKRLPDSTMRGNSNLTLIPRIGIPYKNICVELVGFMADNQIQKVQMVDGVRDNARLKADWEKDEHMRSKRAQWKQLQGEEDVLSPKYLTANEMALAEHFEEYLCLSPK